MEHCPGHISFVRPQNSLNKFKKAKLISSISSDHNYVKLEMNYKKKTGKFTNMWSLNNML